MRDGFGRTGGLEQLRKAAEEYIPKDVRRDFQKIHEQELRSDVDLKIIPTDWIEFAVQLYVKDQHRYMQFPFTNRRYLKEVINSPSKSVIYLFGRQCEKCLGKSSTVSDVYGHLTKVTDVKRGDVVLSLGPDLRFRPKRVSRVYDNGKQNFIRISTRLGHRLEVTRSHPIRTLYGMTLAGELKSGDRVAGILRGGEFGEHQERDSIVVLIAGLIRDGCIGRSSNFSYTQAPGPAFDEFVAYAKEEGVLRHVYDIQGTKANAVYLSQKKNSYLAQRLVEDGLWGHKSGEKFVPSWVFRLSKEQTALFLNRLWSTDGFVRHDPPSRYEISYCSISEKLIDGIQALLWKFGIPSKRVPYKPKGGQFSWKLYIQTQQGVRTFLEEIGALGKSEGVPNPTATTNNNRYTIPKEINEYLKKNVKTNMRDGTSASTGGGLERVKLKYAPSPGKLARYAAYIDKQGGDSQFLWDLIEGDVVWDTVESVEDIGEEDAYDIEIEDTHNYIANGIVTHNSTSLGNICLTNCCLIPSAHVLYVAPTAPQAKIFSRDRLAEPVEISPRLKQFTSKHLPWNIFEKTFINQAKIILRYCYLSADRIRGIAADILMLDEMQDILTDNVPIMEETLSHSPLKKRYYAGTPKAAEGSLGHYWDLSTQNEWVVPCDCTSPRFWNILGERNIGLKGLICERCGKPLNPYHEDAQWAQTNQGDFEFEGYRVPQIMVPIHQGEEEWKSLLTKREKYSPSQFNNEVLALFSSAGDKPITEAELRRCCREYIKPDDRDYLASVKRRVGGYEVFAGIDWGSGDSAYTVLCLASYFGGPHLQYFYFKRFIGQEADPVYQIKLIIELLVEFNVNIAGVDWGFGHVQNAQIAQELVDQCHVARCYYSANPKHQIFLNPGVDRFTLHRSAMMANLFNILKTAKVELPRWDQFRPFGRDVLNIFSAYNENLRMIVYDHPPTKPDDTFHAMLYCLVASFLVYPREDFLGMPSIPQLDA